MGDRIDTGVDPGGWTLYALMSHHLTMSRTLAPIGHRSLTRREFLKRGGISLCGAAALPALVPASVLGEEETAPSNRIAVGVIGRGAMGSGHLAHLAHSDGYQVVAVCDVDKTRREQGKATVEEIYAASRPGAYKGCAALNDYRELLARADIDAVLIATPDHWHALQSIDAAKAGKDIYCEKPVCVTIREGRQVVEAVKRYGRVFQTGTQYRSIPAIRRVCEFIRQGRLGHVKAVYTPYSPLSSFLGGDRIKPYAQALDLPTCGKSYAPVDFALPEEPVPDGLDWDLWVGPAPWRSYNPLYHINPSPGVVPWSFDSAFGVTSSTWFLSHAADVIHWALGVEDSGPVEIIHPSSGQYPTLTCRYHNGTLLHFVDHWRMVKEVYRAVPENARLAGNFGGLFVGERGWITTMSAGGRLEGEPESLFDEMELKRTNEVNIGSNTHHKNWLECMHSRRLPSAHAELGHRSASLGILANIACITGRSLKWDPVAEAFVGDEAANRLLSRPARAPWHL
jgi:hypothetical protein